MKIDLHIHTNFSDGDNSPQEIVQMALHKNLAAIAITDHDTVEGIGPAEREAQGTKLEIIPGVELSVNWKGRATHLLGYYFNRDNKQLQDGLLWIQQGRIERNERIVERLIELGCSVSMEEVGEIAGSGLVGRPHFARLLIKKGVVRDMEQAFGHYLGAGAKAYIPRRSMDLAEAVALLHHAGGAAVVAHPFTLGYNDDEFAEEVVEMAAVGLDGLEVFYPKHSRSFTRKLRLRADELHFVMTGGSDYHGNIRSNATLAGGKNVFVSASLLDGLRQRVSEIRSRK